MNWYCGREFYFDFTKWTVGREKTFEIEQVQAIEPLLSLATIPGTVLSS
jgi:hypothetical protein